MKTSTMKRIRPLLLLTLTLLAGCSGSEADYTAVYQVVPDAHVLYLGNHYLLAKDNDGNYYFIQADGFGEASYVKKLF